VREGDDRADHLGAVALAVQSADERAIDLDRRRLQAMEIAQRRIPGAEIIQAPCDTDGAQPLQRRLGRRHVGDERAFGDLQLQAGRVQAGLAEDGLDAGRDIGIAEMTARDVDAHEPGGIAAELRAPGRHAAARLGENQPVELSNHPGVFSDFDELGRAEQAARRMAPPRQRLEAGDPSGGERHDRLMQDFEFVTIDGVAQIGLDAQSRDRALAHRRVEQLARGRGIRFRALQRDRRVLERVGRMRVAAGAHG